MKKYSKQADPKTQKKILIGSCVFLAICLIAFYANNAMYLNKHSGEIHPPTSITGKNYEEVITLYEEQGFTNITTEKIDDLVVGFLKQDGDVESISINGSTDFTSSDWFEPSAKVVISYHTFPESEVSDTSDTDTASTNNDVENSDTQENEISSEEIESGSDINNSSNTLTYYSKTLDECKLGNTGVYAYRGKGSNSNKYIIIDFDEGYVYDFSSEGDSCDRIKIDSGDLNEGLFYTFHDTTPFTYNLHFKYVNMPSTLIMLDNDNFDYEYTTTDLDAAKKLKNSLTIYNW